MSEFDRDDFDEDEELDEEEQAFLDCICEAIDEEENRDGVYEAQIDRVAAVMGLYKLLSRMFRKDKSITVSYKLYEPFKSMGSVSINGKSITFKKTEMLVKAICVANNFEVYPKTDGSVTMTFTFHGLVRELDEE